jgi:quercetin dioxygenase-like cupin family protein
MNEFSKEIGLRINDLRELSEISTKDFAEQLNIDEETYILYEKGEKDIPASLLNEIANIFDVDLSLLLTGEETRMNIFDVTKQGKGASVDRRKEYKYENLCKRFSHKKSEFFIVTVDPKEDRTPSLNSHPGQEFNYILEGSLKLFIHNNEIELNPGDSVIFDSNYKHAMIALNDKPAKFLAVLM